MVVLFNINNKEVVSQVDMYAFNLAVSMKKMNIILLE